MGAAGARRREFDPGTFRDRQDAGRRLAAALREFASARPLVLGLPRGGVPVAWEVARALNAPLDVWVARKVGVPWHPELGLGAVAEGGYLQLNDDVISRLGVSQDQIAALVKNKQAEVAERVRLFRGEGAAPVLRDRTVILVDDGVATGGTTRAAIHSIRAQKPKAIVLAVPVGAPGIVEQIASEVERVVCLRTPADLQAIGLWYADFREVSDDEVIGLLDRARRRKGEDGNEQHRL